MAETKTWKGSATEGRSYANWGSSVWDSSGTPTAADDIAVTTGVTYSYSSDVNLQGSDREVQDLNFNFTGEAGHISFRPGAGGYSISFDLRHVQTASGSDRLIFRNSQEATIGRVNVGLGGNLTLNSALELGMATAATTHASSSLQQFTVLGVTTLNAGGSLTLSRVEGATAVADAVHLGTLAMNGGSLFLSGGLGNTGSSTSIENVVNVAHVEGATGTISANKAETTAALVIDGETGGTFGGVINDGAGQVRLVKKGEGSQTLTAVHGYTGTTLISGGQLILAGAGSINSSSGVTLDGGTLVQNSSAALEAPITWLAGTITGDGVLDGPLSGTGTGAKVLDLARQPTQLTVTGDVSLDSHTTLRIVLNGLTPGTQYSHLLVNNELILNNTLLQVELGFTPEVGEFFTIATFSGMEGTFHGLAEGSLLTVGSTFFQIHYGNEEITLQVVPEPGSITLSLVAMAGGLFIFRRRNRRSA